jgi:hypothetical protein
VPLEFGGAFSADGARVTFGLGNTALPGNQPQVSVLAGVGLLSQSLQFQYQQPVQRIYELGTKLCYYIAGRAMGNASIARILGPRQVLLAFYQVYGNVCNAAENILEFAATTACGPAANDGFLLMLLTGVVLTAVADGVRAEDMVVSEQLQLMFISLLASDNAEDFIPL